MQAAHGLTPAEAAARLAQHGPNKLAQKERASALGLLAAQFKNTLIVILLAATVLSAFLGEIVDAAIILAIVLFCAILGFVQEYRAERALDALKRMLAPTVRVLREGIEMRIPSADLVPGDIMLLEAGDRISADARLIEIHALKCDEAALTGESFPVDKSVAPVATDVALADRRNIVFAGTVVSYGRGKAVVTNTGMKTEFGQIAEQVSSVERELSPLEKRTAEIGRSLGLLALGVCAIAIVVGVGRAWLGNELDWQLLLTLTMFAIALAVAAVPEALAAIVTGALAVGMHEMAKRNALVRRMPAVETLGCTTVICSDKTGTLTKGEMTVRRMFVSGRSIDVGGAGYAPTGAFEPANAPEDPALNLMLTAGLLCNDAQLANDDGRWFVKGDPTEGALAVVAAKAGIAQDETRRDAPRIAEFPFSSERKRMTTVHRMPDGRQLAFVKGAPEVLLDRCVTQQCEARDEPLTDTERARILAANEAMASSALRVLAVAYKPLAAGDECDEEALERDLVFLGLVGMMDPPRDEVKEAVRICREVCIRPVMITGDHRLTAVAVAAEIGIHREGDMVLTGEELERLGDEEFGRIVDRVSVYARVSPMDKLKIVRAWKNRGEIVAMTGDGVNDAPALKHADIGIAMGISGTDVAKESADMVLGDDNFATIVSAIERGRWIYDNIKKYLTYLLRANITEVVVLGGVVIAAGPEYLPLLPAAILYINLATDGLPALALGLAPPDRDIMQRPPRNPSESVFSKDVRVLVLLGLLIECPILLWVWFDNYADLETARTEMFLLLVFIELTIVMSFRSLRYSIFEAPPHKWLLIAMGWEIALACRAHPAAVGARGIRNPDACVERSGVGRGRQRRSAHYDRARQGGAAARRVRPGHVGRTRAGGSAAAGRRCFGVPLTCRRESDEGPRSGRSVSQLPIRAAARRQGIHEQHRDGDPSAQRAAAVQPRDLAVLQQGQPAGLPSNAGRRGVASLHADAGQLRRPVFGAPHGGPQGAVHHRHRPSLAVRSDPDEHRTQELADAPRREFGHQQGAGAHLGARRGDRGRLDVQVGALRHPGRHRRRAAAGVRRCGLMRVHARPGAG